MIHKKLIYILTAVLFAVQAAAQTLYVGSYNIRCQNSDDAASGNGWQQRCK